MAGVFAVTAATARAGDSPAGFSYGIDSWYVSGTGSAPYKEPVIGEAAKWGALQASWTLTAMRILHVTSPAVWADIKFPGIEPAPDNGWKDVCTGPCSWHVTGVDL